MQSKVITFRVSHTQKKIRMKTIQYSFSLYFLCQKAIDLNQNRFGDAPARARARHREACDSQPIHRSHRGLHAGAHGTFNLETESITKISTLSIATSANKSDCLWRMQLLCLLVNISRAATEHRYNLRFSPNHDVAKSLRLSPISNRLRIRC